MRYTRLIDALTLVAGPALVGTSCGGGGHESAGPTLVDAGNLVLEIDDIDTTTTAATGPGGVAESDDGSTETTIPLNEEDAGTALFDAAGDFFACMSGVGGFQGVPSEDLPADAPVNSQAYLDSLQGCAARSDIINAINNAEDQSDDLSPEQVESRNRNFVVFRECLIGRGWQIPQPAPDEIGLLFGGNIARDALSWSPPDGETIADSDDLEECGFSLAGGSNDEGDGGDPE